MDKHYLISDPDIIREYHNNNNIKKLSTKFKIPKYEIRKILKRAGIKVETIRKTSSIHSDLNDVGMSINDFLE